MKLQIRLQAPAADGSYKPGAGVYSSGRVVANLPVSQICDLRRGVAAVNFSNITLPSTDPQYIEKLRLVVRFYRFYAPHAGLPMTNSPFFFFRGNGGFTDNLNDGPTPAVLADSEEFERF